MKYDWMDEYLLRKKGVTKDLQADWNWIRYQIGGKMFAAICLDDAQKPVYITFKLEPEEGNFLRQQYEDIIPGYYMNKVHWNSVRAEGAVPDELLMDLLEKSYQLVLGGFSKKKQKEILKTLKTGRLWLRPWKAEDAEALFEYAKDPDVGPIAGWPPHKNVEESREVIKHVLNGEQCYAICEKGTDYPIGAIELRLNGKTDMTNREDECELGYWLGKPFWGRGYMPEAAEELLRYGFEELGMRAVWCGYYDGNQKSARVQEKCGFQFHHTCKEVPVPCMNEIRVGHTNLLTREQWENLHRR